LPLDEIRALEAYLAPTVAGGPPIPPVVANGDLVHGRALFSENCQQCHGLAGEGGDLGALDWAPSLGRTSIAQVAEAVRVGPDQMPVFGEQQLSESDLNDVASYVWHLQTTRQPKYPPFRSSGPVPEGAVAYIAMIVLVAFVFTFWRVDTPAARREEAVRRDEGERRRMSSGRDGSRIAGAGDCSLRRRRYSAQAPGPRRRRRSGYTRAPSGGTASPVYVQYCLRCHGRELAGCRRRAAGGAAVRPFAGDRAR